MTSAGLPNRWRRRWLGTSLALAGAWGSGAGVAAGVANTSASASSSTPPRVVPRTLVFPRDAGAHPEFKTEWWYITGWLGANAEYGFQITFFRSRVDGTQGMRSRMAARQLLFAHAAITDVKGKRLWHDQRMVRWSGEAPGSNPTDSASASLQDTGLVLRDWTLLREGKDLHARIAARNFAMDLRFGATQPVLLQGDQGLSRKGPDPRQASYYYSLPQLRARGALTLNGTALPVAGGAAWLDHEWSEDVLSGEAGGAVGWDWLGINLLDGSALTAFQLRDAKGAAVWDGGSFRAGDNRYVFQRGEVVFKPVRLWRSAANRASYPVEWIVRTPADFYTVKAVLDNQEQDSSQTTGTVYWEGLVEVWDSNQRLAGRGYLEMTGYASPLRL
jgi:predicted secreted hydrolase